MLVCRIVEIMSLRTYQSMHIPTIVPSYSNDQVLSSTVLTLILVNNSTVVLLSILLYHDYNMVDISQIRSITKHNVFSLIGLRRKWMLLGIKIEMSTSEVTSSCGIQFRGVSIRILDDCYNVSSGYNAPKYLRLYHTDLSFPLSLSRHPLCFRKLKLTSRGLESMKFFIKIQ